MSLKNNPRIGHSLGTVDEAQQTVSFLRFALATATRERDEARERWAFWEESAAAPRRLNEDYIRKLMDAVAEQRDVTAERDAAVARLNRIREWAGGLGWLGSPQDERVETEALAILDSVDRWQSCPDYIRGLPHTECAKCGGFGAVPAPQKGAPE